MTAPQDPHTHVVHSETRTSHVHTSDVPKASYWSWGGMTLSNILAIIGFIILIVIVIWGLIHLARLSSPWFASLFDSDNSAIVVTAPAEVNAGDAVKIDWSHDADVEGMYAFMYQCVQGVQFKVTAPDETRLTIPCGAAFSAGATAKTITVIPTLTGTSTADANISIVFIPREQNSDENARGNHAMKIVAGTPIPEKPTPTPARPKPTTPTTPSGTPDLSVQILRSGVIDLGGVFVQRAPMNPGETAAVEFVVVNNGTGRSGSYSFTANLPTQQPYTYTSPVQAPLAPGSRIVSTLKFTQAVSGTFMVNVDPYNSVRESNESNNTATQYIQAPYFGY